MRLPGLRGRDKRKNEHVKSEVLSNKQIIFVRLDRV